MLIQHVARLLIDNDHKVGKLKAAMVNNFAAMIACTTVVGTYKSQFDQMRQRNEFRSYEDLPDHTQPFYRESREFMKLMAIAWDVADTVFQSGYNVKGAENGAPTFMKSRVAAVSNLTDYVTTLQATQGDGAGGEIHRFENWNIPLQFGDGRLVISWISWTSSNAQG